MQSPQLRSVILCCKVFSSLWPWTIQTPLVITGGKLFGQHEPHCSFRISLSPTCMIFFVVGNVRYSTPLMYENRTLVYIWLKILMCRYSLGLLKHTNAGTRWGHTPKVPEERDKGVFCKENWWWSQAEEGTPWGEVHEEEKNINENLLYLIETDLKLNGKRRLYCM